MYRTAPVKLAITAIIGLALAACQSEQSTGSEQSAGNEAETKRDSEQGEAAKSGSGDASEVYYSNGEPLIAEEVGTEGNSE